MDITHQILDEHLQQRQMFADLHEADRYDPDALASLWERLGNFLEVHAAAEEAVFYPHFSSGWHRSEGTAAVPHTTRTSPPTTTTNPSNLTTPGRLLNGPG